LADGTLAQPLIAFLYHENPHVRHSSLTALFKLQGAKAEEHLLHAIHDREAEVRQAAVSHLASINSRHSQAFDYYNQVLNPENRSGPNETDAVLIEVCRALSKLAEISPDEKKRSEELLLAALRPVKSKGPLGLLKKPAPTHSETVQAAIWDALSALGHEPPA
jgi:HEAT repeat protein